MIPVCEPALDGREAQYVHDCLETNWISSAGKYISMFEEKFSAYCDARHGVACSSGTTAIHLAMTALGIGVGDEVIIPDFTLIVSANMVILAGARPVLVDVDRRTWCLDPKLIEAKITPRTKAIMAVHMYGHPCDMDSIMEIARKRHLYVIEDCAEAHGAEVNGKKVRIIGDVSCFSFYGNKILTTGEGGMVVCNDDDIAKRLRFYCNQGFQEPRFVHSVMGYNYRLTNVQAAIGLPKPRWSKRKSKRSVGLEPVTTNFCPDWPHLTLPVEETWAKNVYWMYGIVINDSLGLSKEQLMAKLREKGVDTRAFFCPMSLQPVFKGSDGRFPDISGDYPVSVDLWNRGLYLPSGLPLTRQQIETVVEKVKECKP